MTKKNNINERTLFLSDISIKRPVFAAVVSLILVIFGLSSMKDLAIREYPDIDAPIVSVITLYKGAPATIIESQVTQIIEESVSGIEGVKQITSKSREERSEVTIEFVVSRDVDAAASDVRDKISGSVGNLPLDAESPIVLKTEADASPFIWIGMKSNEWNAIQLSDYADRYLVDTFSVVPGVAKVLIGGERRPAMRIWLNRSSMAAYGVTVNDIEDALLKQNLELPSGRVESDRREFAVRTDSGLVTEKQFEDIVITQKANYLVRLSDVAEVNLGTEEERYEVRANEEPAIGLGVIKQSKANELEIANGIRAKLSELQSSLPKQVELFIAYDRSRFVDASIKEVFKALAIAMCLVIAVIFLFLRSFWATLIPAVAIPVSLISSFIILDMFGFSINVLTLLAYVLAVGLVVDDAIIVLENIHRRIENNEPVLLASIRGSRQIGFAVIATTLSLIAVFVPLSMMGGNTGRLFSEFGISMAGAVLFSSLVALTLTPMMCSKILKQKKSDNLFYRNSEKGFLKLNKGYEWLLDKTLSFPIIIVAIGIAFSAASYSLYKEVPKEFAPTEDRGVFLVVLMAPEGATLNYTRDYLLEVEGQLASIGPKGTKEIDTLFGVLAPGLSRPSPVNFAIAFVVLKPWEERERSQQSIVKEFFPKLLGIPGANVFAINPPSLNQPGRKAPVQFVLGGPSYDTLKDWSKIIIDKTKEENPKLLSIDGDYKETKPELKVNIDRNRAAAMEVSIADIGRTLETMLGSRFVTTLNDRGIQYNVVLQARGKDRETPNDLENIYVRNANNDLIPLNNLITTKETAAPKELNRFDRMRSVTISASLAPGYSLGEALDYLDNLALTSLPPEARISYAGQSREFRDSSSSLMITFGLALLIVFLVLAAQFESFVHPIIIMLSVPLAITGALATLYFTGITLNVYSQIGLVMLIGLVAKNAILIVEFANQLREEGKSIRDAVKESAAARLRPILMTTIATVFGAMPLALATGAGAESRSSIGWVIVGGVTFSTVLSLFVVPTLYSLLARFTKPSSHVADKLRDLEGKYKKIKIQIAK
ncbi:efflux RND transporter permease subunit [Alphaproteobacteria bacterium]|nr:efflux RND transporter permease subunit [Alphaproteobacteria bacterium]